MNVGQQVRGRLEYRLCDPVAPVPSGDTVPVNAVVGEGAQVTPDQQRARGIRRRRRGRRPEPVRGRRARAERATRRGGRPQPGSGSRSTERPFDDPGGAR